MAEVGERAAELEASKSGNVVAWDSPEYPTCRIAQDVWRNPLRANHHPKRKAVWVKKQGGSRSDRNADPPSKGPR